MDKYYRELVAAAEALEGPAATALASAPWGHWHEAAQASACPACRAEAARRAAWARANAAWAALASGPERG